MRIILDIKTPGSGEVDANVWGNLDRLKPTDEVKFVVCDRDDFDWSAEVIRSRQLTAICPVLFSAAFGQLNPTELACDDSRIRPAGSASASAAQDSLGPRRAGRLNLGSVTSRNALAVSVN